jgi:hypothetical protein
MKDFILRTPITVEPQLAPTSLRLHKQPVLPASAEGRQPQIQTEVYSKAPTFLAAFDDIKSLLSYFLQGFKTIAGEFYGVPLEG